MAFNNFPYTDMHELNLDWVISETKRLANEYLATQRNVKTIGQELEELEIYVKNYFSSLDIQQEIKTVIDEMAESGTLQDILIDALQDSVTVASIGVKGNAIDSCAVMSRNGHCVVNDFSIQTDCNALRTYIKNNNLIVDAIIISHYHNDHIGGSLGTGLSAFLSDSGITFNTGCTAYLPHRLLNWDYANIQEKTDILANIEAVTGYINQKGLPIVYPIEGATFTHAGMSITFHNLSATKFSSYYSNHMEYDGSIAEYISYNNFSMISTFEALGKKVAFTSDIYPASQALNLDALNNVNVLFVEHHGINYISDPTYLAQLNPDVVHQQSGSNYDPVYYLRSTLTKISNVGCPIYSTVVTGTAVTTITISGVYTTSDAPMYGYGNIQGLANGSILPEGTDLNNVVLPGKYYTNSADTSMTNVPVPLNSSSNLRIVNELAQGGIHTVQRVKRELPPFVEAARQFSSNGTPGEWRYSFYGPYNLIPLTKTFSGWEVTPTTPNEANSYIAEVNGWLQISISTNFSAEIQANGNILNTGIPTPVYTDSKYWSFPTACFLNSSKGTPVFVRLINVNKVMVLQTLTAIPAGDYLRGSIMMPNIR